MGCCSSGNPNEDEWEKLYEDAHRETRARGMGTTRGGISIESLEEFIQGKISTDVEIEYGVSKARLRRILARLRQADHNDDIAMVSSRRRSGWSRAIWWTQSGAAPLQPSSSSSCPSSSLASSFITTRSPQCMIMT